MTRGEAMAGGFARYVGKACNAVPAHGTLRYVATDGCVACNREAQRRYRRREIRRAIEGVDRRKAGLRHASSLKAVADLAAEIVERRAQGKSSTYEQRTTPSTARGSGKTWPLAFVDLSASGGAGGFPKPVKLTAQTIAWKASQLEKWISERPT